MQSSAQMLCFLALALRTVASDAGSAGSLRQTRASKEEPARRLAYPSADQLLTPSASIKEVDVMVYKILHEQCRDIFVRGRTKEQALAKNLELNLTRYDLQSVAMNVDNRTAQVSTSLTYTNGTQAVYTEEYRSRSFGCTISDPKYAGIMDDAQNIIDGISYDALDDMQLEAPEYDVGGFEDLTAVMCDKKFNDTRSLLVYQKGKLVWEKYCAPDASKDSLENFGEDVLGNAHTYNTYIAYIRAAEGKYDLDKLSTCPELSMLEKRARNMTGRNLAGLRTGKPLHHGEITLGFPERAHSDISKVVYAVPDKANFAAMVPSAYNKADAALKDYIYYEPQLHFKNAGSSALLQRELRFTFPDTSQGFAEYASYAWTHLFKHVGAKSVTYETDATGTIVGSTGFFATSRDLIKLAALFVQKGKWNGKQILPLELIDRNLNCPHKDCSMRDDWYFYTHAGIPEFFYKCNLLGCFFLCPEFETVLLFTNEMEYKKRFDAVFWSKTIPLLTRQMKYWADKTTTTTTSTTTTTTTTTSTTVPTTTTTPVTSTTTTTSSSLTTTKTAPPNSGTNGASNSNGNDEEPVMSTAARNTLPLWMTSSLVLMLRLLG